MSSGTLLQVLQQPNASRIGRELAVNGQRADLFQITKPKEKRYFFAQESNNFLRSQLMKPFHTICRPFLWKANKTGSVLKAPIITANSWCLQSSTSSIKPVCWHSSWMKPAHNVWLMYWQDGWKETYLPHQFLTHWICSIEQLGLMRQNGTIYSLDSGASQFQINIACLHCYFSTLCSVLHINDFLHLFFTN